MTITYDNGTQTWSVQLEPNDIHPWARYRARLKDVRHEPISHNEAMKILVFDAWRQAKIWTRTQTKELRDRAYENATPAQQEAAQAAAEAALEAAIGFDPEA
jgi:hypothetical protein